MLQHTAVDCSWILWKWLFGAFITHAQKKSIIWIHVCHITTRRVTNVIYN